MVIVGCRQPGAVIGGAVALIAQHQHNLFAYIYGKAAEHGISSRLNFGKRIQHKLVWHRFALPDRERACIWSLQALLIRPWSRLAVPSVELQLLQQLRTERALIAERYVLLNVFQLSHANDGRAYGRMRKHEPQRHFR